MSLKNILYIEDDENLARLLARRMERLGYKVAISPTGEDGIKVIRNNKFDIVLLDHHLPGMSGLDVLDALAAEPHPPIIILTASGDERLAINALEKGAADYAVKDVNLSYIDLLPAVMQATLTKARLQRENDQQRRDLIVERDRAASASQAKTDFLAMMSHEIRTPMNVVVGLSDLLGKTQLDDKQVEMVKTLRASADLLLTLINDLLDLSRIEAGQLELEQQDFRLSDMLDALRTMFQQESERKGLKLITDDGTRHLIFVGDQMRLQQVLMNLIGNALKFTHQGSITIGAVAEQDKREPEFQWVTLTVRDTGIGIASDKLPTIFEKFVQADQSITRRFGGSGLGLAICRSIVNAMGGTISAESRTGEGSRFIVRVPLRGHEAERIEPVQPLAAPAEVKVGGTVLLVEDYPANIMVATMLLEGMGFTVDSAPSGTEAVEKMEAATQPYAAILMDVQMSDMDGYDTTRAIRMIEQRKGFRHFIIGITAHALAGDREKCIEAGMDDYMSKPINPDLLAKKLLVNRRA